MDLDLTSEQAALRDVVQRMVADHSALPRSANVVEPRTWHHAQTLERDLEAGGFYDVALQEGCGACEAAIIVHAAGFTPLAAETSGSALIGPLLTGAALPRAVAVARLEDLTRGVRFLPIARTLIVDLGADVAILSADDLEVQAVASNYAYPLGRLARLPDLARAEVLPGAGEELRRLWRIGLALEIGSALEAGLAFTADYVKNRVIFNRPLGSFQAVQHRLSADVERARGVYWLAMKAACSGSRKDAALAVLQAQKAIVPVNYDLHQFNGALGMTLEHALHFWTFRLRWLMGELGGYRVQAAAVSALAWPSDNGAAA